MNAVQLFKLTSFLMPLVCILIIVMVLVLIPSFPDLQERGLCLSQRSAVEGRSVLCEQNRIPFFFNHVLQSKYDELLKRESDRTDSSDYVIYLKHDLETNAMSMKPAARYTGRSLTDSEIHEGSQLPESSLQHVTAWSPGRKSYDTGGYETYGMSMDRGRVTVPVAGFYQVYSSVEFYEVSVKVNNLTYLRDTRFNCFGVIFLS